MNHSMPGLPVHHQLPEFTQTHVHRVGYAIQQSHPLSSPSPPAPNPSQYHFWKYAKHIQSYNVSRHSERCQNKVCYLNNNYTFQLCSTCSRKILPQTQSHWFLPQSFEEGNLKLWEKKEFWNETDMGSNLCSSPAMLTSANFLTSLRLNYS